MGTPENESRHGVRRILSRPDMADKIRLLKIGEEVGLGLMLNRLSDILEEIKEILLPLVEWMDNPIFPGAEIVDRPVPERFLKKRGMYVFESSIIDIWLQRSGQWFLRFRGLHQHKQTFREVGSSRLAKILFGESDNFLKLFSRSTEMLEELPFLKDITLYYVMFPRLISEFLKPVRDLVKHRKERISAMEERLNLLTDFSQSLDPLVSQGKEPSIKGYSIFNDHERGTTRYTADYFFPKGVEPFWNLLKEREMDLSRYRESITEYRFDSLKRFLQRMIWVCEDIRQAAPRGRKSLDPILTHNDRLPFTEGEIEAIKEVVSSITGRPITAVG